MLPPDGSIDPDTPPMNNRGYRIVLYKYFSFRGKRSVDRESRAINYRPRFLNEESLESWNEKWKEFELKGLINEVSGLDFITPLEFAFRKH